MQLPKEPNEEQKEIDSYLTFRVGEELYAAPLLSIKEVIEALTPNAVPYTVEHFKGVINLRGQIVSVLDLSLKFNMNGVARTGREIILIVETPEGPIGALVDEVLSVNNWSAAVIEKDVQLEFRMPVRFFLGIAKLGDRLVTLLDLASCISHDELRAIKSNRLESA